jgi:hypothetical protein
MDKTKQKVAPKGGANPNSTQNALQIAEVRDGIVIMNDGTFRVVVMCKAINFDLMSPQEREAIEFAYQGFLNSLNFPIQIFMRSEKMDIKPYLKKLEGVKSEHDNMLLGLLIEDYISFLDAISQQSNIMDKQFYTVISYPDPNQDVRSTIKQSTGFFTGVADLFSKDKDPRIVINEQALEEAKTELRNRVQAVIEGLLECSVKSIPLDTQELIELYYNVYNPDTATRQHLGRFEGLSSPVIEKATAPRGEQP